MSCLSGTRSQKSYSDANGPPVSRAARIAASAESPRPLIADIPKRMRPSGTVKDRSESLTVGGRTFIPIDFASAMYFTICELA